MLATSVKTGTILLSTLSYFTSEQILIFRSVDNGLSFTGPVNGAPGFNTTNGDQDKEWITVDNFPGSGFGNVYMFWRNFGSPGGMTFTKSTDDGLTWGPAGGTVLASGGQGAQVVVGPDHAVYCFWYDSSSSPDRISMRKSTDFGASFGPTVTVTTLIGTGVNGDLGLGGLRSSSFPQVVVNPVSSNLYIVYPDVTAVTGGDRGNIYFRQSTNGGTNWSASIKVNDDSTTQAQFQPATAVRPDGAGLAVCWYDRRRDPAGALIERWGVTAAISGNTVTFGPNFRLSPQFPAVFGVDPGINSTYMGDYDMMAADTSFFYTTWGDNRDASIAVPSRNKANIRSAGFTRAGPGAVLDVDSVLVSGGNGNGVIDPNECNILNLVVRNDGTGTATNITASLSSTTPGVSVAQSSSSYPDLAPGAAAASTTAFTISTDPSFVCGTPVKLGTGDVGNHGDDITTPISLPFSYTFYGQAFTSARVSANGNLQFTGANSDYVNACLPAPAFANTIFAFWDDLRTDGTNGPTQGIYTNLSGVTPNRVFNLEWRASYYSANGNGNPVNFEMRLYEGQQRFDLIYGALNGTGSSATVGAQKDTGGGLSNGLQLAFQTITCPDGGGTCGGPIASFTAGPTSGLAPLTVNFTNSSSGATDYGWDFGDGNTSTAINPANTYTNAGNYTVSLRAIGGGVTNTLTRANYILVTNTLPTMPGLIAVSGDPYVQDFNSMGPSGTNTPPGWYVGTGTGAISGTNLTVDSGSSKNTGNYNYGSSGSSDRALGSLAANSIQRDTDARFVNRSGAAILSFTIRYTGEQWRLGGRGSPTNHLVLQYSTDGINFTALGAAFNFNSPLNSGHAGPLDGNAPANRVSGIGGTYTPATSITNGQVFYLRWA
ncbi:MAG: hypothetical protein DME26_10735, partial [Verrucomicrobia bacterium]